MPEDLCVASVFIAQSGRNVVSFHFSAHMDCQTGERNRLGTFADRKDHFRHIVNLYWLIKLHKKKHKQFNSVHNSRDVPVLSNV